MSDGALFKTCGMCGRQWATLADFILDPELSVRGYQADLGEVDEGIILLTHVVEGCRTTLGVRAAVLRPLYDGPEYQSILAETEQCCLLCLEQERVEDCDAPCKMAWVRHALQCLLRHELPDHMAARHRR